MINNLPGKLTFPHVRTTRLAATEDELHAALADLDTQLTAGDPAGVRLNAGGELIIPQLAAEGTPTEADALRDELAGMLPVVPLASLLVEVDAAPPSPAT